MHIVICDDCPGDAQALAALARGDERVTRADIFTTAQDALAAMGRGADAYFLDIVMPGMDGVALAGRLRQEGYRGAIVFLTGSNDFAYQSYRVGALDYLLKPPTPQGVRAALDRIEGEAAKRERAAIAVKTPGAVIRVQLGDISHVEVINHTVAIRMVDGQQIETRMTFADILALLARDRRFVRCHRSFVINMGQIEALSEWQAVMKDGRVVPISRGYAHVREQLVKWMFGGNEG